MNSTLAITVPKLFTHTTAVSLALYAAFPCTAITAISIGGGSALIEMVSHRVFFKLNGQKGNFFAFSTFSIYHISLPKLLGITLTVGSVLKIAALVLAVATIAHLIFVGIYYRIMPQQYFDYVIDVSPDRKIETIDTYKVLVSAEYAEKARQDAIHTLQTGIAPSR